MCMAFDTPQLQNCMALKTCPFFVWLLMSTILLAVWHANMNNSGPMGNWSINEVSNCRQFIELCDRNTTYFVFPLDKVLQAWQHKLYGIRA